jgi:uncharacterized protein YjbI with pentapeptide repeats
MLLERDEQEEIQKLKDENFRLKTELGLVKTQRNTFQTVSNWLGQTTTALLLGKGLKESIARLYSELPRNVSRDTMAEVTSHLIWRITRLGVFAIMVAAVPLMVLLLQTYILSIQNEKLDYQNRLIANQNHRLDQQIQLEEGNRRSSFIFMMSNIMDKIDEELKTNGPGNRGLSDELIGRIVSLSQALMPYRYLENDQLTEFPLSPERGQLLFALINSLLDRETYDKIFERANFSFADLKEANFTGAYLRRANLSHAYLPDANFKDADLEFVNLSRARLPNAYFENTYMHGVQLERADLRKSSLINVDLQGSNLYKADLSHAFINGDFSEANFEGVVVQDAEIDFALLSNAYFQSTSWLDSLKHYNLKGIFSIQENYLMEPEIVQLSRTRMDTLFVLKPRPDSKLVLMEECERTVLAIVKSSPAVKEINQKADALGQRLVYSTEADPFGSEDRGIEKDSVYLLRITANIADAVTTMMWVEFNPRTNTLSKIQPGNGKPAEPLSYNHGLLKKLKPICK